MRRRRGVAFNTVLWPAGILLALGIATFPLIREQYARMAWEKVPCRLSEDGKRFFFDYPRDGKYYGCARMNMWPGHHVDAALALGEGAGEVKADYCYVNGSVPPTAVHRLNAYEHLEDGAGHFAGGALVLGATVLMGVKGRPRAVKKAAEAG